MSDQDPIATAPLMMEESGVPSRGILQWAEANAELPELPVGYTRKMTLHMKLQGGAAAEFDIFDAAGERTAIHFGYTKLKRMTKAHFAFSGQPRVLFSNWASLRTAYPTWRERVLKASGSIHG